MDNIEVVVARLRDSFEALQRVRSEARFELKAKYRRLFEEDLENRLTDIDLQFARELALAKAEYDIPVTVLQSEVLRTNAWAVWQKWRDLGEIPPERVRLNTARERAGAWFRWTEGYKYLEVYKTADAKMVLPVVLSLSNFRWVDRAPGESELDFDFWPEGMPHSEQKPYWDCIYESFRGWVNLAKLVEEEVVLRSSEGVVLIRDERKEPKDEH